MSLKIELDLPFADFHLQVALDLPGRGITALFGPSGSGKTSLLRCVAGLEHGAQGRVMIGDECWQDSTRGHFLAPHKRALGYVFQEASLFPHLSVRGNLEYGQKRIAPAARRIDLDQAVQLLGIGHLLERHPDTLSGGERQRVGIARALLTSPRLLLLDEPLAALDSKRKQEILPYLERLHDELDIPMLYVSHAADEVARLADHLVLLDSGRALASGPLDELLPRLDLPLAQSDTASTVLHTRVCGHDSHYQLLELELPNSEQRLRIPHAALPAGQMLRLKVPARDVSLSLEPPGPSSILNRLPVRVLDLAEGESPAQVLVRLELAGQPLLARITRYSHDQLGLHPGQALWAQFKAVALLG
ncbi:molybdenum ABC transporter ATP-binding protein [Pseudomonas sp. Gutcm_11s]|uniref:molybdenum ABC transporter ATP-binding protein n=1 Tax=Pseudomonas sp. Gutcm_11s TaxID=3026088 RepID=UPI00235FFD92|nr:molybdenum ABC transporter ATP-binding protein [Pseudomonas sp. Gutcm_11s]MDD0842880.1 molybdenum ABC transporter ATP-binding protein [Pseudomonas sp. Gutcm_11s]